MDGYREELSVSAEDPISAFSFSLDIQGLDTMTFAEAEGFDNKTEGIDYREVKTDGTFIIRKTFGKHAWGEIKLRRGMTKEMTLWQHRQHVLDGNYESARKNGSITGRDPQGNPTVQFTFEKGWISAWNGPKFSAKAGEVAMEEVTFSHEGLIRVV